MFIIATTTPTCGLNCQNGGILETTDACLCYCVENTYGPECEYIDCSQTDLDPLLCSIENQPICLQSEIFYYQCLRLCGEC